MYTIKSKTIKSFANITALLGIIGIIILVVPCFADDNIYMGIMTAVCGGIGTALTWFFIMIACTIVYHLEQIRGIKDDQPTGKVIS